jgi:hypothetical protein
MTNHDSSHDFVPNSFQTPTVLVDQIMPPLRLESMRLVAGPRSVFTPGDGGEA